LVDSGSHRQTRKENLAYFPTPESEFQMVEKRDIHQTIMQEKMQKYDRETV